MSFPTPQIYNVTSTGLPMALALDQTPTNVLVFNNTKAALVGGSTSVLFRAIWNYAMQQQQAFTVSSQGGSTNPSTLQGGFLTANGIGVQNTMLASMGAQISFTAISATNPAQITLSSATGVPTTGAIVIIQATGMSQIVGMPFYYTLSGLTMTLPFLDASTFAAPATTGIVQLVQNFPFQSKFPTSLVTKVITGATTQVQLSYPTTFQVGNYVPLAIPPIFGQQLSLFLTQNPSSFIRSIYSGGKVLSVDTATNTLTLDINTTGQGSFAFPSSTAVDSLQGGLLPEYPQALYGGNDPAINPVSGAQNTANFQLLTLGSGVVGSSGDILVIEVSSLNQSTAVLV